MSAIFQRPLCEMGAAYDFALRPVVGEPDVGSGGPCDDRPHAVEMFAATADPSVTGAPRRSFSLCPEHETQLRRHDARLTARGIPSRFLPARATGPAAAARGR
jgi:hypothetical protein